MVDSIKQIIKPTSGWVRVNWSELWFYRELFGFLVWRDILVKYKQTVLGAAWAIIVPFFQMLIFTVIFGKIANLSSEGLPKPIFYYTALLPWAYFASSLNMASQSMVGNSHILTKVYFPRLMVPAAPCIAGLVDFCIAFILLIFMMVLYQIVPPLTFLLFPFLILVAFGTCYGTGLVFSALNVKFRDIRYVIPFLIQIWMYCTVIVPFSSIPERFGVWRYLYGLNPMAGVIEGFRWCLLHNRMHIERIVDGVAMQFPANPPWILVLLGTCMMILILMFGLFYFRRMERMFADIV